MAKKKNKEKWDMAKEWCRKNDYHFKVVTEEELGLTNK